MDEGTIRRWVVGDMSRARLTRALVSVPVCVYLSLWAYGCLLADRAIFQPPPASYSDGDDILKIPVDGVRISALFLPQPEADYTVLYSHGNAEDLGDIRPFLEQLRQAGFAVVAYDYRGYGTSDGRPSERAAYADIEAVYAYLMTALPCPKRVVCYGRSVGGGPAVHLAAREEVSALILESSFVTAFRVVTRIPLLPIDKFRNIQAIPNVECPILVIHGTRDGVIPVWHGRKLHAAAGEPKFHLWVEGAGHNNLVAAGGERYWQALREFRTFLQSGPAGGSAAARQ